MKSSCVPVEVSSGALIEVWISAIAIGYCSASVAVEEDTETIRHKGRVFSDQLEHN